MNPPDPPPPSTPLGGWRRYGAAAEPSLDFLWLLGLTLGALGLFLGHLGDLPLRDWDEGTHGQVAREIYRNGLGGWLHPTLWGQPYFNKPPLVQSLMALAYHWGGVNAGMARLPGALFSAASVPLLYGLACQLFPQRGPARWGSAVYLTLLPVVRHGRLAMLDGAVVFFFLGLLFCCIKSRRSPPWIWGMGLCFGLLVLTKGLIGGLLLALTLGFMAWDRPRSLASPTLWASLILGSAPAVAWYGLQWHHYGSIFLEIGLGNQNFDRIWSSVENNHGPPWYYLLELLKYGWPWLIFLPQGFRLLWGDRALPPGKLLLVWLGGYLGAISLMGTKLPWYIFPLYPALALTVGLALHHTWQGCGGLGSRPYTPIPVSHLAIGGLTLVGGGAISALGYFSPWGGEPNGLLMGACGLVSAGCLTSAALARQSHAFFIPVVLWSWFLGLGLFISSDQWLWELAEDYPVEPVAALITAHAPPGAPVYTTHPIERPSLNFYCDRRVQSQDPQQLTLALHVNLADPSSFWLVPTDFAQSLGSHVQILGTVPPWSLLQPRPPNPPPPPTS